MGGRAGSQGRRILAAAVTLAVVGGLSAAAATQASAATSECGSSCVDLYSESQGPGYILDAYNSPSLATAGVGTPVILDAAQNSNPGEDFVYSETGTVGEFNAAGLLSDATNLHYGDDNAYELEYAPGGTDSGLCPGLASTPTTGMKVDLEPCGVSGKTVWILVSQASPSGSYALVNGDNYVFPPNAPYVLTAEAGTGQLEVDPLQTSGGSAVAAQDWNTDLGVVASTALTGTGIALGSSANPALTGQTVTYTATVSPAPDGGTVSFSDGGTPIAGCTAQPVSVGTGQATCEVSYASPGSHSVTASYGGGEAFSASAPSGALAETVNPAPTSCTTTITGTNRTPVTVTSGVTCLTNAAEHGAVTVDSGAGLVVTDSTVNGAVTASGASAVSVCGSTVSGTVSISGTSGAVTLGDGGSCAADTISGSVTVSGSAGQVTLSGLTQSGTLTLSGNAGGVTFNGTTLTGEAYVQNNAGTAAVTVSGNSIKGKLYCAGNTPAPGDAGSVNTVTGVSASDQCTALAVR